MTTNAKTRRFAMTTITTLSLLVLGTFAMTQSAGFRWFGPLTRVLTPNGDGSNDVAFFCFDNPADSDVSGKVYSLLGGEIAPFGPRQTVISHVPQCADGGTPAPVQFLTWDGRSNGSFVHSGIYVYRVMAEGKIYSGTLIVVR